MPGAGILPGDAARGSAATVTDQTDLPNMTGPHPAAAAPSAGDLSNGTIIGGSLSSTNGGVINVVSNVFGATTFVLYPRELADINGDGRADIVAFGARLCGNGTRLMLLSIPPRANPF